MEIKRNENNVIQSPTDFSSVDFSQPKLIKVKPEVIKSDERRKSIGLSLFRQTSSLDSMSSISEENEEQQVTIKHLSKKLLSGFHPYFDEEYGFYSLQCSTCCIGWWRHHELPKCETFISFPIYCWLCCILPCFLILLALFLMTIIYASWATQ